MRLISCYIEGYGAIEKKDIVFNEGITAFCQDNGTGKTTLASFIKAMFYGLEGYTERSKKFLDREHFYPFKGGNFGGNLTFTYQGKTYKIERFFGQKSTKGDTLKVYCNGEITEELGEEIGKTVFGVDEESFLRTAFINSEEIEIQSTSSINAKLGSFLQGIEEEDGFKNALKKLETARKNYQADRRSKTPTDLIPCLEMEIDGLKREIDNAERIQKSLDESYARAEELQAEMKDIRAKIVVAQEENEKRKAQEHYESLAGSIAEKQDKAKKILDRYPMGLPTEEETLAVGEYMMVQKEMLAQLSTLGFSVKDSEKLARLQENFERGIPTEEEILTAEQDIDKLTALKTEIDLEEAKQPTAREKELSQKFLHVCPTEADLTELSAKVEEYKQAKKEYEDIPSEIVSEAGAVDKKQASKGKPLLAVFSAILFAVSAIFFGLGSTEVGFGFLAVGGIMLLLVGVLFNKPNTPQTATMYALNPEKQRKEREMKDKEYSIKATLTGYGYHSDNGVVYDFAQLKDDAEEYARYLSCVAEQKAKLAEKQAQKQALEQKLTAFFRSYGLSGDTYMMLLSLLRNNVSEYYSLTDRQNTQGEKKATAEKALAEARLKIEEYKNRYGLTELALNDILADIRTYKQLCVDIERGKTEAEAYRQKEGLTEKPMGERVDLAELNDLLDEKQQAWNTLEKEIRDAEMAVDSLGEMEAKLDEKEELLAVYKQRHKLLNAAHDFLKAADESLRDKYVKPIKDEFLLYAEVLEKALGEKVVMTKNFEIRFEREGADRSEKHLSAGQRSICALCFRLALIKNMYRGNPPFLILDDPFVSLDKTHMERVKEMLQTLSSEMQMVYFTCHESRCV